MAMELSCIALPLEYVITCRYDSSFALVVTVVLLLVLTTCPLDVGPCFMASLFKFRSYVKMLLWRMFLFMKRTYVFVVFIFVYKYICIFIAKYFSLVNFLLRTLSKQIICLYLCFHLSNLLQVIPRWQGQPVCKQSLAYSITRICRWVNMKPVITQQRLFITRYHWHLICKQNHRILQTKITVRCGQRLKSWDPCQICDLAIRVSITTKRSLLN